jgi:hypothetical protein
MKNVDFSAFDKAVEEYSKADTGAASVSSEPDTLDDFLSGAAQGATFGFADELGAALDVIRGRTPSDSKGMLDAWRTLQKAREAEYEQVKERSPTAALTGELLGGFAIPVPGAMAAGAGKAIGVTPLLRKIGVGEKLAGHMGTGTAVGGLAGLGTSKGAIEESPLEVLKDVGTTAGFGGVTGGVLGTAADKFSDTIKAIKETPTFEKLKASVQTAAGERPDYKPGESILFGQKAKIIPGEELSGSQKVLSTIEKDVSDEVNNAVKMQSDAKESLNLAIDRNKEVPARPSLLTDDLADTLNSKDISEAEKIAYDKFYKSLPEDQKKHADKLLQEYNAKMLENLTGEEILSKGPLEIFVKIAKKYPDSFSIFSKIFSKELGQARIKNLKNLAIEQNDASLNQYADGLSNLLSIIEAEKGSLLEPIKKVLFAVDNSFMRKLATDPYKITAKELFDFRKNFLARANIKAIEKDLNVGAREILFGIKNPQTGKYDGGVFNNIENIMKSSSEDLKKFIDNVNAKSQHIEVLLNNHPDPKFHGSKAWDFDDPAELRNELSKILTNAVSDIGTDTISAQESGKLLMDYFTAMLKSETNPEIRKQLMDQIRKTGEKFERRGFEFGAMAESTGIDRTSGMKGSAVDPTSLRAGAKQSTLSELGQMAGRMKKSAKETLEEIPSFIKKPVTAAAKLPFTFKGASEDQLRKAAEVLKRSDVASVRRFGEGISESATNNPAVRNAIIHSAFQREDIRKALGLNVGEKEKEE